MDEFRKDPSFSTPIKPSAIPRIRSSSELKPKICTRKETNENEEDLQNRMSSKLQNPKKPSSITKHFMSPTISAASKVTTPRKKILMERNETSSGSIFSDTHVPKRTLNLESGVSANLGFEYSSQIRPVSPNIMERNETSRSLFSDTQIQKRTQSLDFSSANVGSDCSSQITALTPKISESDDNGDDSASQAYDPLTNYLSPRPKFLRYNPNRRLEILQRRESETKQEGKDGFVVNQSDSDASLEPEKLVEDEAPSDVSSSQEDGSSYCNDVSESKTTSENEESDQIELKQGGGKYWLDVNQSASFEPEKVVEEVAPSDASEEDGSSFGNNELESKNASETEESDGSESESEAEVEEVEEVEDEDEEEEKGKGWNLKQVLKFLLVLGMVVISTFSISFMNSPNPPPTFQALVDLKEGFQRFQVGLDNYVAWNPNQELLMEATETNYEVMRNEEMGEEEFEKPDEISELSDVEKNQDLVVVGIEGIEDEVISNEEMGGEEFELPGEISNQVDEIVEMNEVVEDTEISEFSEVSQNEVVLDTIDDAVVVGEEPSASDVVEVNSEKEERNEVEVSDGESTSQIEQQEDEVKLNEVSVEEGNGEEIVNEEMVEDEMEKTVDVTDGGHEEAVEISETSEVPQTQFTDHDQCLKSDMPITSETIDVMSSEVEQTEPMKAVSIAEVGIGISVVSVIVASVLGFLRLNRQKPSAESVLPKKEEAIEDQIDKADSLVKPSSSVHYGGKASNDLYRSWVTPTVELLGEFTVEESRNSLKSCSLMKSKTIEGEESNFSVSISEKKSRGRRTSSISQDYTSLSEFSTSDSPSYGSFTTQERIIKKEGRKDGEEIVKILTTPVRRSSRIRSKSVMSP